MPEFTPKVTIIIPVYNGSNYLKEAIDSALAQTYKNIEVVVVNDGSKDKGATEKIAKSYGDKIKYYRKPNGGVASALNLGIKKMTGEYLSWLSHDDKYRPEKIKTQIEHLRTLKDKNVILFSNYDLINERGKLIGKCIIDSGSLEKKPSYVLLRGYVNGITLLIPKSAFDDYGEFDESLRCTQDYDMWLKMMKTYRFVHLENRLSMTRIHSTQDTAVSPLVVTEGDALWKRMINDLPDDQKIEAEGSLLLFYLEMVKFLKFTPYNGVAEYCKGILETVAQTKSVAEEYANNKDKALEVYRSLIQEGLKRTAAYYLESVIKQTVKKGNVESAINIVAEELVGKEASITNSEIENNYISKIGKKSVNKKRLLFSSGHWLTGGMERVLSVTFEQLKNDYELFLITAYDGRHGLIELPDYVTHIKVSNEYFYDSFDHIALSYALILDIDVAIGFMNLFDKQLGFYDLCVGSRVKTVASNHEMYFYPYMSPNHNNLVQRRLDAFSDVDAVLWLTNFSAAVYGLAHNNSFLLPNPNAFKVREVTNKGEDKIILCVGRFNDYVKRVDRILNCFSIVSKRLPEAKLMLVGACDKSIPLRPGDDTTIADLLKQFNINENKVNFVGEVNNVEKYYGQASLLLLASKNEGFGMVINEAACFGVPSVCNKIPGLEDLVVNGVNGFLTEQGDIESMADAVTKILSDRKLRAKLGDNAKKMVTKFDEEEIGNKWKFLIDTLLETSPDKVKISKLNEYLSYTVTDYKIFSQVLFEEANSIVATNIDERNRSVISEFTRGHYLERFMRALITKGPFETSKIISKKVYRKLRR